MAIIRCTCKNAYQDEKYGKQLRVANPMKVKQGSQKMARCTVCLATHAIE